MTALRKELRRTRLRNLVEQLQPGGRGHFTLPERLIGAGPAIIAASPEGIMYQREVNFDPHAIAELCNLVRDLLEEESK